MAQENSIRLGFLTYPTNDNTLRGGLRRNQETQRQWPNRKCVCQGCANFVALRDWKSATTACFSELVIHIQQTLEKFVITQDRIQFPITTPNERLRSDGVPMSLTQASIIIHNINNGFSCLFIQRTGAVARVPSSSEPRICKRKSELKLKALRSDMGLCRWIF